MLIDHLIVPAFSRSEVTNKGNRNGFAVYISELFECGSFHFEMSNEQQSRAASSSRRAEIMRQSPRARSHHHKPEETLAKLSVPLSVVFLILIIYQTLESEAISKSLFMPHQHQHLRFCYQPGDQLNQQSAPISTQCVYCSRNQFDYTLFKCTGLSAVSQYINTTQAFCIIAQCLEQIRNQTPVLLG